MFIIMKEHVNLSTPLHWFVNVIFNSFWTTWMLMPQRNEPQCIRLFFPIKSDCARDRFIVGFAVSGGFLDKKKISADVLGSDGSKKLVFTHRQRPGHCLNPSSYRTMPSENSLPAASPSANISLAFW